MRRAAVAECPRATRTDPSDTDVAMIYQNFILVVLMQSAAKLSR
jgi:hypothetical protein